MSNPTKPTTAPAKRTAYIGADSTAIVALDKAAAEANLVAAETSPFRRMVRTANAMAYIKDALTDDVMAPILALQGSPLGFRTDRDNGDKPPYGVAVVKECLIEATLRGLQPCGNQWNIIGGRCYVTKEGLKYLLDGIAGLQYMITTGIPRMTSGGAIAPVHIEWVYKGQKSEKDIEFPIRVNQGMGADAVNGKATRKARAWLHAQITGMEIGDGEAGDEPLRVSKAPAADAAAPAAEAPAEKPQTLAEKLRAKAPAAAAPEDAEIVNDEPVGDPEDIPEDDPVPYV